MSVEIWAVPDGPEGFRATAQLDGLEDPDLCPTAANEAELELVGAPDATGVVLAEFTPESRRGERGGWKLRKEPARCSLAAWSWENGPSGEFDSLRFDLHTTRSEASFEADTSPTSQMELISPALGSVLEAGQEIEIRLPGDAPSDLNSGDFWTPDPVEGCLRGEGELVKMRVEEDTVFLKVRSDLENHLETSCQTGLQLFYPEPEELQCGLEQCSFSMTKALWLEFDVR